MKLSRVHHLRNIERAETSRYDEAVVIGQGRVHVLLLVISAIFLVLLIRLYFLTLNQTSLDASRIRTYNPSDNYSTKRHNIYDKNDILLASNLSMASIYVNPKEIIDAPQSARLLSSQLGSIGYKAILEKLQANKQFVWLQRCITPNKYQAIHDLGIPGIHFVNEEKRVYPHSNLFSHVLGGVNNEGMGITGIERYYNTYLKDHLDGGSVQLTLDTRLQNVVHSELQKVIKDHDAKGAVGIVMDVHNGDVLSMVNLPDFNPNNLKDINKESLFNKASFGVYEMGSTVKPLTVAMGIDSHVISYDDAFDVSQPMKIDSFTIKDYRGGKGGVLSVPEILMYSSNIGIVQIADRLGIKRQKQYFNDLGLFEKVSCGLPELSETIYPTGGRWGSVSLATISYGHGFSMTPLHLAQASSALYNGGYRVSPRFIKSSDSNDNNIQRKRVFNKKTADVMQKMLYLSVAKGSGRRAKAEGYYVAGKTGTSEKVANGKYLKNSNVASFVGAFPAYDPQYLLVVMVDEAQKNEINRGFTTGGMVAAPVAGQIINQIAPILNVVPKSRQNNDIVEALNIDYTPRYKRLVSNSR